jgi:spore coat polysaccharide biosynthesis protein SpsF
MSSRTLAIIQARMGSTRLPGKVLADLCGQPVLSWIARRAARAQHIDQVVVATSDRPEDEAIAKFCDQHEIAYWRGSMHDVLDRYYQAAQHFDAQVIVRLTGDCPLIDAEMLDANLTQFFAADPPLDFAANRLPDHRTIPIGLDAEYVRFEALKIAWQDAKAPHQREHVMPFFYEHPQRFNIAHFQHKEDLGHYRWTVDTPEDLELLRAICGHFQDDHFSWQQILKLFDEQPDLAAINAQVSHKSQFDVDKSR